jgi:CRISPR-associated endoribonuclease Cas6
MPTRWQVTTPGIDPTQVKVEQLHAVVSAWFDHDDTHRASAKPYTVSPPAAATDGAMFEVGLLDDDLTGRLLTRAAPGIRLRFGSQHTTLSHAPQQTAGAPWKQLAAPTTATAWCIQFVTPTTFRRGNAFTPWPAPKPVLGGLRAAWRHFAPTELPNLHLDMSNDPVWVTDIDGANQVVTVNHLTVSGFVGRIRYTCDATPDVCAAVDRLMRLAPYAGIGAYTTRGFGLVRLEHTWQQR